LGFVNRFCESFLKKLEKICGFAVGWGFDTDIMKYRFTVIDSLFPKGVTTTLPRGFHPFGIPLSLAWVGVKGGIWRRYRETKLVERAHATNRSPFEKLTRFSLAPAIACFCGV